jgi:elongation factor P hydroxylase
VSRRSLTSTRPAPTLDAEAIAVVFNATFAARFATVMLGGAEEPLYLPGTNGVPARILYRSDFAASALHEAAHWCIAGPLRRRHVDYGYGYVPPPRPAAARRAFFDAERDVQALECAFAESAGLPFRISADDFAATAHERDVFAAAVARRCAEQRSGALPARAMLFSAALVQRAHETRNGGIRDCRVSGR